MGGVGAPNRKSRVAALQMRDLPARIQRENPLEGVAAPFRSWLINLHTNFFVSHLRHATPYMDHRVHPISNRDLKLPDSVTSLGYIEIYFVYRRYNLRGLIPCNDPACHEPETSSAFSFAAG